ARKNPPVNQALRRIGRTFAVVLPVVLVMSGTLAVARVPWAGTPSVTAMEAASAEQKARAPQDVLEEQLLLTLRREDPTAALTGLQEAVTRDPSLAPYCADIARSLGQAAVEKYGSARRAQEHARPVCDTSYAAGVASSD